MTNGHVSTVRHRRLTAELRRLREATGLTRDEVAVRLEWSASKVTRIETGRWVRLNPRDIRDLLDLYGVTDQRERDAYVQLAREARQRGWWTQYDDVFTGSYVGLEAAASSIDTFEPQYVPGLLQTDDYIRAVLQANPLNQPEELDRRVEARITRQALLTRDNPPEFWVVIDEAALRRPIGGEGVMHHQLTLLTEVSSRQNVTLQVLPTAVGAHPGMDGAFVILTFPDPKDRPVVYLETATDGLYLEEPEMIRRYTLMLNHLRARALGPEDSLRLITEVAEHL